MCSETESLSQKQNLKIWSHTAQATLYSGVQERTLITY